MKRNISIMIGLLFILGSLMNVQAAELKKGDKMELIKFDKGEMFGSGEANISLTKEKAEKGKMYSCKVSFKKGDKLGFLGITGDSGLLKGKRGNWEGYDSLNIKYISTASKPIRYEMLIGDQQALDKWRYGNYCSRSVTIQPGENVLSIDITGIVCDQGRQMDLTNMRNFLFYNTGQADEDFAIYFLSVWVEKE